MTVNDFSKAQSIPDFKDFLLKKLSEKNLDGRNTLWATSVCSDEVNQSLHQIDKSFETYGPFTLGGISGIPFAGTTGFNAFASHIPDHGGALIIYGPHIGITSNGEIGKVLREGQNHTTSCCGSIIGAIKALKSENASQRIQYDFQQKQVKELMMKNWQAITSSKNEIIAATEIAYNNINMEIREIIQSSIASLNSKPLLVVGGILINTDPSVDDRFEIRDINWY